MNVLTDLHSGDYKRATFYFPSGDESAVDEYIITPDHKIPGEVRDLYFKFCGQKLKKSKKFTEFVENNVPSEFKDRFSKSEKGIDIEICCDAFRLAAMSKIDRLFLLTNDDDFLPFVKLMKEYGSNISLIHLSAIVPKNISLLREFDTYDVVAQDHLQMIFLPLIDVQNGPNEPVAEAETNFALKPEADPSDLVMDDLFEPALSKVEKASDGEQ